MDFLAFRWQDGAMAESILPLKTGIIFEANCKPMGGGSMTIGDTVSTVMVGKLEFACALAGDNAATVRTAVARTGSSARSKVEMWRVLTSNNTSRRTFLAQRF